jgi:hemerythrin-like metal-binding protein
MMSEDVFDQRRFVQTHAAMLELLDGDASEAALNEALAAMQDSLQQQFSKEEQAMQAAQFGPLDAHKKDHDQALQRLSARIAQWQETHDRQALLEYLEGPFSDWFVRHVNSRDFITAQRLSLGV